LFARVAVGSTLVTVTDVAGATPAPPSLSVAVRLTTYVPLSSGVKVKSWLEPDANGAPSFVTDQL
jgi:hypothetical protein